MIPILIAIIPRVVRLLVPYAWFEDSAYTYIAFAIKSGQRPFLDFVCVHPPALESFLSLLYQVFGVSYRVAEIFTAIVIIITSLLLYDICRKLWGRMVGNITVVLFSLAALLARYHIFEREIFTLAVSTCVLWLVIKADDVLKVKAEKKQDTRWLYILAGILCGIGLTIKSTGILIVLPVILFLLWRKQYAACLMVTMGFLAVGVGTWSYYLLKFGKPALYQLIFFHLAKGNGAGLWSKITAACVPGLNYLWIIGAGGLVLSAEDIIKNKSVLFIPVIFFIELIILFLFLNPTVWAHNLVDLLLPLSIGSGLAIWYIKSMIARHVIKITHVFVLGLSFLFFLFLGALDPNNLNVGWEGHERADLDQVVAFVRRNTPADLPIHAPHHVATEAQRLKLVPYDELTGPYSWVVTVIETKGYWGLRQSRQFASYYDMIEKTMNLWRPRVNEAIAQKKISAAVWDSESPEWLLNYEIDVILEERYKLYSNAGYAVKYEKGPYVVWLPEK